MIPNKFAPPPMSKGKKIWLGVLSIAPGIMFISYFVVFFGSAFYSAADPYDNDKMPEYLSFAALLLFFGFILTTVITIYHIVHISKNFMMSSNDKLVWMLIVLLLPWIGDVIFWYMKIWKEQPNDPTKSNFY